MTVDIITHVKANEVPLTQISLKHNNENLQVTLSSRGKPIYMNVTDHYAHKHFYSLANCTKYKSVVY